MKKVYLFLCLVCVALTGYAATYTSAQNGNWTNPLTWSPVGIPIPGDVVIINHNVTLDTSFAYTTGSITVNAPGSLIQDSPIRDIWVNGVNTTFVNSGYVDIRNLLISSGSLTNDSIFLVKSVVNYAMLDNNSSGSMAGIDSLYNDGTINNNGMLRMSTFYNNSVMNNYANITGNVSFVDSMYNAGTFLNNGYLLADSCTNSGTFTNNDGIVFQQFTNLSGTFTNNRVITLVDMTNVGTFNNVDSVLCNGSVTNTGTLNNQAGAYIDLAVSFLNADPVNFNAQLNADGRMVIGDSFYNFDNVNGSASGSIQCADTSYNSGIMSGTFDFCDLTPPGSSPYIDINPGTVAGTITFCTFTGIAETVHNEIGIYPNPTNGIVSIQNNDLGFIEVLNILGEQIMTTKQKQIDLSSYDNGVYFLRIKDLKGNLIGQERIIKQ